MTPLPTEAEPVRVIEGDCLDVLRGLPDNAFDVVVTDPPYGTGGWRRTAAGQGGNPAARLVREDWDAGDTEWVTEAARVAKAILTFWPMARTSGLLAKANDCGLTKHRALYLHKPDPKPQPGGRIQWSVEPVWALSREGFQLYGGTDWLTATTPRLGRDGEAVGHPYQKPLSFVRWLLRKLPDAGLILDPFAGSGTTGIAALKEGRRAVLIESDPDYAATARRRVAEAMGVGGLFAPPTPTPEN